MGILDEIGSLAGGAPVSAHDNAAFDQAAQAVPHSTLAESVAHAFNSDQTPPFEQMVAGMFGSSNPDQKAGLLNQILGSLGPNAGQILSSLGAGGLAGALSGGTVTPQQAEQVSPQAVQELAQAAAKKDPSIVDKAAGFYAQHPTLVKALGAGALALILSRISAARR